MPYRVLLVSLCLLFALSPAWADDDVLKDEQVFRRQVRVLATVERDAEALRKLVNRVADVRGGDAGWLEAWFEVGQVLEQQGQRGDALALWMMVTNKYARELTEAQKTTVQEAMMRVLPAGASVKTPLGTIAKVSAAEAPPRTSPLEQKIRDIFAKLSVASVQDQQAINRAQQQVVWALRDAGPEIYPVLGRIIVGGQPEQARFAAEKLAQFAKVKALPFFERALRSGDGMARAAALRGYSNLSTSDEHSPEIVEHIDALLAAGVPEGTENSLRQVLRRHLPLEELLKRYAEGGAGAAGLLGAAMIRAPSDENVIREAIRRAEENEGERGELLGSLIHGLWTNPPQNSRYLTLDPALLRRLVGLMAQTPATSPRNNVTPFTQSLDRLQRDDPGFDADTPLHAAWQGIVVPGTDAYAEGRLNAYVRTLLQAGYLPPEDLFLDAKWRAVFFRTMSRVGSQLNQALLTQRPSLWSQVFDVLPDLDPLERRQLLQNFNHWFDSTGSHPGPLSGDRAWGDVLEMAPFRSEPRSWPRWLLRAVGAEGDARLLDAMRRARKDENWRHNGTMILPALADYKGPGLLEFLEEGLRAPYSQLWTSYAYVLDKQGAEGRALLSRLAGDWTLPVAETLVKRLPSDDLKRLYPRVLAHYDEVAEHSHYLDAVIAQAKLGLHKEAVPLLLHAYREHVKSAAEALDAIREYRERLQAFEGWLGEDDSPQMLTQRLRERLAAAKTRPAERKALVYALAVRHGKAAVDVLVDVAANDPDESVRKAAMDTLEAMALKTGRGRSR